MLPTNAKTEPNSGVVGALCGNAGVEAGYICHKAVRRDTGSGGAEGHTGESRYFPYPLSITEHSAGIGLGSTSEGRNHETIWCETIDAGAGYMIKSNEPWFTSELRRLSGRFSLKDKDFA